MTPALLTVGHEQVVVSAVFFHVYEPLPPVAISVAE
jgi:hypothetical protein